MTPTAMLLARIAARPLLMRAAEANDLALRLAAADPARRPRASRVTALLRKVGLTGTPAGAWDDEDGDGAPMSGAALPPPQFPRWLGDPEAHGRHGWALRDGVGVLTIDTALAEAGYWYCGAWWHGYDTISAALAEMAADDRVRAVHLSIDSPGGLASSALPELGRQLLAFGKPVQAYARMAASAAYWIAASCRGGIACGPFDLIGSIGCAVVHWNYERAYADAGIAVEPITFGRRKLDGAHWSALGPEARDAIQADVDRLGEAFVLAVSEGRGMAPELVRQTEAACFMGEEAVTRGLADQILTEREAFEQLAARVAATTEEDMDPEQTETAPAPEAAPEAEPTPTPVADAAAIEAEAEAARAAAILELPEAQGREALAEKLAKLRGVSPEDAAEALAAAPKPGLLDRARDHALSPNGEVSADTPGSRLMAAAQRERAKVEAKRR